MSRTDDAEVTSVDGRHLDDTEALRGRDHGGVDRPQRKVTVPRDELSDAQPVLSRYWFDGECARGEIPEEAHLRHGPGTVLVLPVTGG